MDGASVSHEEPDDDYAPDFVEESSPKSINLHLNPGNEKYKILKSSPHPGPIPSPLLPEDEDFDDDDTNLKQNKYLREYLLSGLQVQKLDDPETMSEIMMQVGSMA